MNFGAIAEMDLFRTEQQVTEEKYTENDTSLCVDTSIDIALCQTAALNWLCECQFNFECKCIYMLSFASFLTIYHIFCMQIILLNIFLQCPIFSKYGNQF